MILDLKDLCRQYPNDTDLGREIRKYSEAKPKKDDMPTSLILIFFLLMLSSSALYILVTNLRP